ncbi:MAG: outer membrane protein assembly factor BamD [bacterium]
MTINFANILKILLVFFLFQLGCKSYNVRPDLTPQERLELAKLMFKNGDYVDAKIQFRRLTLNNRGLEFSDEAQFFLAECHFYLKEYVLASDEYNRLVRLYPHSQWTDDASFKVGVCNYKLSPKASLDQKYTLLAVQFFQLFLEDYPDSQLVPDAEKYLKECRTKLAEKDFKAGKLYLKLNDNKAALVYFDSVLEDYYDTSFAKDALFWKGEGLYELRRKEEALGAYQQLLTKYPKCKYAGKAKRRVKSIEEDLKDVREVDGVSSSVKLKKN